MSVERAWTSNQVKQFVQCMGKVHEASRNHAGRKYIRIVGHAASVTTKKGEASSFRTIVTAVEEIKNSTALDSVASLKTMSKSLTGISHNVRHSKARGLYWLFSCIYQKVKDRLLDKASRVTRELDLRIVEKTNQSYLESNSHHVVANKEEAIARLQKAEFGQWCIWKDGYQVAFAQKRPFESSIENAIRRLSPKTDLKEQIQEFISPRSAISYFVREGLLNLESRPNRPGTFVYSCNRDENAKLSLHLPASSNAHRYEIQYPLADTRHLYRDIAEVLTKYQRSPLDELLHSDHYGLNVPFDPNSQNQPQKVRNLQYRDYLIGKFIANPSKYCLIFNSGRTIRYQEIRNDANAFERIENILKSTPRDAEPQPRVTADDLFGRFFGRQAHSHTTNGRSRAYADPFADLFRDGFNQPNYTFFGNGFESFPGFGSSHTSHTHGVSRGQYQALKTPKEALQDAKAEFLEVGDNSIDASKVSFAEMNKKRKVWMAQLHPDRNGGDASKSAKFKDLQSKWENFEKAVNDYHKKDSAIDNELLKELDKL